MESKTNIDYEMNDDEIIYMINENSDDAKDYLYNKYSAMIHKEINRVKKSAYALSVEFNDLVQEALLGFSNAINSYDDTEEASFSTYATLCVRRKLINYLDKYRTQKNYAMVAAISLDSPISENGADYTYYLKDIEGREPLNKVMTDESLTEITEKFSKILSDEEKKAIEYSINGNSISEISELMGLNVKKVYNLLYRARKKIRLDK